MPVTHFLTHFPHFKAEKRGFCEEKMQFFKLQAVLSGGASARSTHFRFSAAFLGHFFMFPTCWAKRLAGLFVCLPFPLLLGWGCQALKQGAQLPGGDGILPLERISVPIPQMASDASRPESRFRIQPPPEPPARKHSAQCLSLIPHMGRRSVKPIPYPSVNAPFFSEGGLNPCLWGYRQGGMASPDTRNSSTSWNRTNGHGPAS